MGLVSPLNSVQRRYWELVAEGFVAGCCWDGPRRVGDAVRAEWFCQRGGVNPRLCEPKGQTRPRLTPLERDEITIGTACSESERSMARRLGRAPSTIMREIDNNGRCRGQRAGIGPGIASAPIAAAGTPSRGIGPASPRPAANSGRAAPRPASWTAIPSCARWSRICCARSTVPSRSPARLPKIYPDRPEMRVSHETIYKYVYDRLYVQGRGELRRELSTCLRTGRALRKPRKRTSATETRGRIPGMVNIAERPPEADDRAVPGHWEGDLIIGKNQASQIGTLVERSSGFVQLLHLPEGRTADVVADEMIQVIKALPDELRRTLTWDQGKEMAEHARISIDADIDVYFCDPHSPWQRGSNENTNGLLRQYFPKGTDLSVHSVDYLAEVAAELNNRPRKRFDFDSPAQVLDRLLSNPPNVKCCNHPLNPSAVISQWTHAR